MRMRIDELAARTGVTSRNIRAYREKGLLPAPQLEGRTGFYTEEHLQRLEIIEDLQTRGFSLEAIRQILDAWSVGGDISHLLGLQSILNSPFHDEEPAYETVPQLLGRFPEAIGDPRLLIRAIALGLLEEHDGDTLRLPSPLLIEAGTELVEAGVPLGEVLDLFEQITADMADVAQRFIAIVERNLLADTATPKAGATPPQVLDRLQRLRPLATEVMRPILSRQLTTAIDQAMRRMASRTTS
jgi:DNA-binding transcriptional MerR regulator